MRTKSLQKLLTAPLWASAFVLSGLIVAQLSQHPAHAEEVYPGRDISYATVRNGLISGIPSMPENLWVLDNNSEMLFIYNIENSDRTRFQLRYRESLSNLFRRASGR